MVTPMCVNTADGIWHAHSRDTCTFLIGSLYVDHNILHFSVFERVIYHASHLIRGWHNCLCNAMINMLNCVHHVRLLLKQPNGPVTDARNLWRHISERTECKIEKIKHCIYSGTVQKQETLYEIAVQERKNCFVIFWSCFSCKVSYKSTQCTMHSSLTRITCLSRTMFDWIVITTILIDTKMTHTTWMWHKNQIGMKIQS